MVSALFAVCAAVLLQVSTNANGASVGYVKWQVDIGIFFDYLSTEQRDSIVQQVLDLWKSTFDATYQLSEEKIEVVKEQALPDEFGGFKQVTIRISGKGPVGFNVQSFVGQFKTALEGANIAGVKTTLGSDGASTSTSFSFTVTVQAHFAYKTNAQRNQLLQKILALFQTTYGVNFGLTNLKITVDSESASPLPGYKLLTFHINGNSNQQLDLGDISTQFITTIQTAHIPGISVTETTDVDVTTGGNPFIFNGKVIITFKSQAELDRILQRILQLWITTYSSQWNVTPGAKITVVSKQNAGNGKWTITYKITGTSVTTPDTTDDGFNVIISNNKITGVVVPSGDGDGTEGGNSGDGSGDVSEVTETTVNIGGGGTSFTLTFTITVSATTDSQINVILQRIRELWIKTYGTKYGINAGSIRVTLVSKTANGNGGSDIIFRITGTSSKNINATVIVNEFLTIIITTKITGVVGTFSGRLQWTITIDGLFSYASNAERDNMLQSILSLWMSNFGFNNKFLEDQVSVTREIPVSGKTFHLTFQITGTTGPDVDVQAMINAFISILQGAHIPGVLTIEGAGVTAGGGSGVVPIGGGSSFTVSGHVIVKYTTQTELNRILQAILKLWIQRYGSRYGATNVKIVVGLSRPTGKGTFDILFRITGTSTTTINVNVINPEFEGIVTKSKITGIIIGGGTGSTSGGGTGSVSGGEIIVTGNGGGSGGDNNFDLTGTITVTVKTDTQLKTLLKSILDLWIKTYGSVYGVGDISIKITSKKQTGSGWTITYVITGTSSSVVTTNDIQSEWETVVSNSKITGITVSGGGNEVDGGTDSNEGGGENEIVIEGNGGKGGNNKFTFEGSIKVTVTKDTEIKNLLQLIMNLWIKKYGSIYGFGNVNIKVTSKVPLVTGGYTITYVITGSSSKVVTVNKIKGEWTTTVTGSHITGIITGGGEEGEETTPGTDNGEATTASAGEDEATTPGTGEGEATTPSTGEGEATTPGTGEGEATTPAAGGETTPSSGTEIVVTGNGGGEGGSNIFNLFGTITVTVTTDTDITAILKALLDLWIQKYGSTYGVGTIHITITSRVPNGSGGFKISYVITGTSSTTVPTNEIKTEWITTVIGSTDITGLVTGDGDTGNEGGNEIVVTGNGGGEGGNNIFNVVGTVTVTVTTDDDLNTLLKALLDLWIQKYGSTYGVGTITITITSKVPTGSGGFKITYVISGASSTAVPNDTIKTEWTTTVSGSKITGIQVTEGEGTSTGGDDGSSTGSQITVTGNGGGEGGTNDFDVTGTIKVTVTTDTDFRTLLQDILNLWIQKYGLTYGVGTIKITITSKQPDPTGGYTITYVIHGSSSTVVPVDDNKSEWTTTVISSGISGISGGGDDSEGGSGTGGQITVTGNGGGEGGSNEFDVTGTIKVTVTTDTDFRTLLQAILNLWIQKYGSTYGVGTIKITITSKQPDPTGGYTITYVIHGSSSTVVPVDDNKSEWTTTVISSGISGISGGGDDSEGGSGTGGQITVTGNGGGDGGSNEFDVTGTIKVTVTTDTDFRTLIQAILNLWIQKYGSTYGVGTIKITITSKQPAPSGGYTITYVIHGSSSTVVPVDDIKTEWTTTVISSGISGISGDGSEGGDVTGGDISVTGNGGGSGGDNSFTFTSTITVTVTTDSDLKTLIKAILDLWITKYGSTYGVGEVTIKITSKQPAAASTGGFIITYTITGTSSTVITVSELQGEWDTSVDQSGISGIVVTGGSSSGGEGGSTDVSENVANAKDIEPGNFDVTLVIYLAYNSPAERNNFLNRLLVIWRNSLHDYIVTGLKLVFVKEQLNADKITFGGRQQTVNKVWYRLTGSTENGFNTGVVSKVFEQTVIDSHLGAVEFSKHGGASAGGSASTGSGQGSGGSKPSGTVGEMVGGDGGAFSIPGTIKLTYRTNQQRQTFLDQVMVMWRNAIWSFQPSNVKIALVSESGSGQTKTVSYVITGTSALAIDIATARETFKQTLIDSHLTGVQYAEEN